HRVAGVVLPAQPHPGAYSNGLAGHRAVRPGDMGKNARPVLKIDVRKLVRRYAITDRYSNGRRRPHNAFGAEPFRSDRPTADGAAWPLKGNRITTVGAADSDHPDVAVRAVELGPWVGHGGPSAERYTKHMVG